MGAHPVRSRNRKKDDQRTGLPEHVEESNSIGADAGDATSGVPQTPGDWARELPIEDEPTFPLEPGDPSPLQPAAGSPGRRPARGTPGEDKERERQSERAA